MRILVLLLIFFSSWSCIQRSDNTQPANVIFILADDLGYGDLGSYGQEMIKTPGLDKMASEGIRFTNFYAGSTVCAPSRCTLMTGLHTGNARIRGNGDVPLNPEDLTVAEVAKAAGYTTGLIGKWGLGEAGSTGIPNKQGFDYFYGYLNQIRAHNYYPTFLWRNQHRDSLDNEVLISDRGYSEGIGSASTKREIYSHDLFTEEALQFLEQNKDSSFFLYLAYTIPHANNEHWLTGSHGMEVPDYGQYADQDWPEAQKGTAAMISRMDQDVNQILDKLIDLGLDENTLVIFSSDNGPHREGENDPDFFDSNGPLRGIKRDLYEGGIRVPTIAWWPGTVKAGQVSGHRGAFWDLLPTFAAISGQELTSTTDGISFLPLLKGQPQPEHDYLYWEFTEQGGKQAIIEGDYKLIYFINDDRFELYNLANDLDESDNLATEMPDKVAELRSKMNAARTPSEEFPLKKKEV